MTFILILLFFGIALWLWMSRIEAKAHRITQYERVIKEGSTRAFDILHLSDTHFASKTHLALDRFFDRLSQHTYDFIFFTGDLIDNASGIERAVGNLRKLKARHGIYLVYGNHDYAEYKVFDVFFRNFTKKKFPMNFQRHDLLHAALEKEGIHILVNETREVNIDGQKILIHGVDDPVTNHHQTEWLKMAFDPSALNLLLVHSVDILAKLEGLRFDFSFSGHSHGGQFRFPLIGPVVTHTQFGKAFTQGIQMKNGVQCVISRGAGTSSHLQARLLCPPEAINLKLFCL